MHLPLIAHTDPHAVVAWRHGAAISARRFLADVRTLAAMLPPARHILNACSDRYRFAVGFCATLLAGKTSLLPSTYTADTLRQLADFAPDCHLLGEDDPATQVLPAMRFPALDDAEPDGAFEVPRIAADHVAAWVFTSGSTGTPVPHRKRWGALVANVRAEAAALGFDPAHPATLVGTVPPQHMYGFESTVLLALLNGAAFDAGRPFYPADIAAALARARPPAVLVSTPFHLAKVLDAGIALPPAALLLSATAPLPDALARRAEAAFGAALLEIYGSTETGQVATRRPACDEAWTPFPGVRLETRETRTWAGGGHIEEEVALSDLIEHLADGRFLLRGRHADLVNIAGKRTSLGWLNQQLLGIPGVVDGSFYLPDDDGSAIVRLAAFVVAPGLTEAALRSALRARMDAAFLPRPLLFVDSLPRNATGKLPRAACAALLAAHRHGER